MKKAKFTRSCINTLVNFNEIYFIFPIAVLVIILSTIHISYPSLFLEILMGVGIAIQSLSVVGVIFKTKILIRLYQRIVLKENPKFGYFSYEGRLWFSDVKKKSKFPIYLDRFKTKEVYYCADDFIVLNTSLERVIPDLEGFAIKLNKKFKKEVFIKPYNEFKKIFKWESKNKAELVFDTLK